MKIFIKIFKDDKNNHKNNHKNNYKNNYKNNHNNYKNLKEQKEEEPNCSKLDPIYIFSQRLLNNPTIICKNGESNHICYQNTNGYYNDIFFYKNGVICKMENIILDPSKSRQTHYIYNGPVDNSFQGRPLLSNGFFNMKCDKINYINYYNMYSSYFGGWNYHYENNEKEEELSPGKTVFFISRNQDSPNLYHGTTDILNIISMMDLFGINVEKIQIVFLESMELKGDPFYEIYKNVFSKGGEPIFIKNLKKKYHISSAIHVPINWDSAAFIKENNISYCKYSTKVYKIYNELIDKYMNIPNFKDNFLSDNETFFYPKSVIDYHNSNKNFSKTITIQWRKIWPKGRKGQFRLMSNGKELAGKLASVVPKNILIRLVNTASLPISEQIALMKKTDYLVGIHGAGLSLGIFLPNTSIYHEILHQEAWKVVKFMSAMSGHITYFDIIKGKSIQIDGNENIILDENDFAEKVIKHLKENNFY